MNSTELANIAINVAKTWCDNKAGISPAMRDEFAVFYSTEMVERSPRPVWEFDDPADSWSEWCDELRGYGME